MKLYQIVLKDITRRKKRMLYTSLGVVTSVNHKSEVLNKIAVVTP